MNIKSNLEYQADRIEAVLSLHKIPARVTGGTVTPRWIRFQVMPDIGTKISKIKGLNEELAAALDAPNCRVSRRGAAVDVEVPRDDPRAVRFLPLYRQLTESGSIAPVTAVLGLAEDGSPLLIRLPSPDVAHILISGTTGSGKTVLMQTMILSLAMSNPAPSPLLISGRPLQLELIDLKNAPLRCFDGLPHLARPVVTTPTEAVEALHSLCNLMDGRGMLSNGEPVVLFIDELADLLMVGGKPIEQALTRLSQRGRSAGIHVVAATQKPTAEVLGPLLKANFPVRICGKVTCSSDARTATGWSGTGAERLMGRGDFLAVAEGRVMRFQAAHVSAEEIREVVAHVASRSEYNRDTPAGFVQALLRPQDRRRLPSWSSFQDAEKMIAVEPENKVKQLADRLRPWWKLHGDGWGAKTRALQYLFGENTPAGGTFWNQTMDAIELLESENSTSTRG